MPLKLYLRGNIWHYRGTVAKNRLRGSTGISKENKDLAARAIAQLEVREWKCSVDGPESVLTFAQAATLYRAGGKQDRFLPAVEDHFKDTLIKDIKPGSIKQMAVTLFAHCTGASRNRMAITPAQAVINHCAELELCPPIRVKRFKVESKIKDPATLEWAQSFRAAAKPHLGTYALFMFLTGARPSEALGIDPDRGDINLNTREVIIRDGTKIGVERKAHLPMPLVAAISNLPRIVGRPLFVYRDYDDMRDTWDSVVLRAGIPRLTPHCCRHGFATELLRRGVDVVTVAWLGGWTSPEYVLRTYGHVLKERTLTNLLVDTDLTRALNDVVVNARKVSAF